MSTEQSLLIAKSLDRCKDFTHLESPVKFSSYSAKDYDVVKIHLLRTTNRGKSIEYSWTRRSI